MLRSLQLPIFALLALSLAGFSCAPDENDPTKVELPDPGISSKSQLELNIDIGDGSKVTANSVLRAAHELSVRDDATITFRFLNHPDRSVIAMSQESMSDLPCDWMAIRVTEKSFEMNDEIVDLSGLRDSLKRYGDVGKLLDATGFVVVAAEQSASGQRLAVVFHEMITAGIHSIIAAP